MAQFPGKPADHHWELHNPYESWHFGTICQESAPSSTHHVADPCSTSNVHAASLGFDLLDRIKVAFSAAGTNGLNFVPIVGRCHVGWPKGPRLTLRRSDRVNLAAARLRIEKRAIAVGVLGERHATSDKAGVMNAQFTDADSQVLGYGLEFFVAHPDHTGSSRTTIAALSA